MEIPKSTKDFQEWIESFINADKDFVYIRNGKYYNELFGISFDVPGDWYILKYNDFANAFNQQTLAGVFEHFKNKLYQYITQPSLLVSKYDPASDEHHGIISPVLNFSIIAKEPEYMGITLTEYAELLAKESALGYMLKNFKVTKKENYLRRMGLMLFCMKPNTYSNTLKLILL